MRLSGLIDAALADPALARIAESVDAPALTVSGPAALRPFAVAALARKRTVLAVTSTGREAEDLADALRCLIPPDEVAVYPGWETLPHERLSPRADTVGQRLAVLRRLAHPSKDDPTTGPLRVVVAPIRSVLQPQVPGLGDLEPVALHAGDTAKELTDIVHDLVAAGYARTELVERRGDFAVRGGILDVFPPTEEHPLRVEFWGDEVEEIRYFKVADQRSLEIAEHGLWAPPCRELLLTDDVQARAAKLLGQHPELGELLEPISRGEAVEGMEALAPGAGRRAAACVARPSCGNPRRGVRSGTGTHPGGGSGAHVRGVPGRVLGGRGWRGPSAGRPRRRVASIVRGRAGGGAGTRPAVVGRHAARRGGHQRVRAGSGLPRRSRPGDDGPAVVGARRVAGGPDLRRARHRAARGRAAGERRAASATGR